MKKCKICEQKTNTIYNVNLEAVYVCERCARQIALQEITDVLCNIDKTESKKNKRRKLMYCKYCGVKITENHSCYMHEGPFYCPECGDIYSQVHVCRNKTPEKASQLFENFADDMFSKENQFADHLLSIVRGVWAGDLKIEDYKIEFDKDKINIFIKRGENK